MAEGAIGGQEGGESGALTSREAAGSKELGEASRQLDAAALTRRKSQECHGRISLENKMDAAGGTEEGKD